MFKHAIVPLWQGFTECSLALNRTLPTSSWSLNKMFTFYIFYFLYTIKPLLCWLYEGSIGGDLLLVLLGFCLWERAALATTYVHMSMRQWLNQEIISQVFTLQSHDALLDHVTTSHAPSRCWENYSGGKIIRTSFITFFVLLQFVFVELYPF